MTEPRFAGLDLGSKRHPSHLAIVERDEVGKFWQIVSDWWDKRPLTTVVQSAQALCEAEGVERLAYDDTRGELQVLKERGEMPPGWRGVTFTFQTKQELAGRLSLALERGDLKLLDDPRQRRQLLLVDEFLAAPETEEGHGDCFWSLALALHIAGPVPDPDLKLALMHRPEVEDFDDAYWRELGFGDEY